MSRFRLHTKLKEREYLRYLALVLSCVVVAGAFGYLLHSIGTARAKSRETVLIYTEEEFEEYLLDARSEGYDLNGRYQLEEDLDLSGLESSIGTNIEPFTGTLDGNGHVISGIERPLFGVLKTAEIQNLFISEAMITKAFTYSDGERYVDGYGALAAYAVDSVIRNCGMNGEIRTASPSEAEYQMAKATPADAEEEKGPGGPGIMTEELPEESSPVKEEEAGDAASPGIADDGEMDDVETEGGTEVGPGVESTVDSRVEAGSGESGSGESPESIDRESSNADKLPTDDEHGSGNEDITSKAVEETEGVNTNPTISSAADMESSAEGSNEAVTEASTAGETEEVMEAPTEIQAEEVTKVSTEELTKASTGAPAKTLTEASIKAGTALAGKTQKGEKVGVATAAPPETIGFRLNNRQHLMMKVPAVVDSGLEELKTASPSNATPSDAEPSPEDSSSEDQQKEPVSGDGIEETKEIEYIGNPDGDIYILVTAERITAGGLIAQTAGETQISESFALITISSSQEDVETCSGGLAGILGGNTRAENSYAAGLSDSTGIVGGFVAVNDGAIENSYAVVTIGKSGTRRGAFTAIGNGRLSGCVYDRQMACVSETEFSYGESGTEMAEENSPSDASEKGSPSEAAEFSLLGMKTAEITGPDSRVPGTWRKTESAYPQLEYFALNEHQTVAATSRASVIAMSLPEELTLADVVKNGDIVLPSEIDGEEIVWEAEGNIRIDEKNQVVSDEIPSIEPHDVPTVGNALEPTTFSEISSAAEENGQGTKKVSGSSTSQLKASVGTVSRNFAIAALTAEEPADVYADWGAVGAAAVSGTLSDFTAPVLNAEGYYPIENADQLAWFAAKVNGGETALNAVVTADISMIGAHRGGSVDAPLTWVPIASDDSGLGYVGNFDGGYHIIDYLRASSTGLRVALIGEARGGAIRRVHIGKNCSFSGVNYIGGVVGIVREGTCEVTECINEGTMYCSDSHAGGIVGATSHDGNLHMRNCGNWGRVTGNGRTGGLVGWYNSASGKNQRAENCYSIASGSQLALGGGVGNATSINTYYVSGGFSEGISGTRRLTDAQMRTWAFAYALNGKSLTGTWEYNEGGYPVPQADGILSKPPDWEAVGQGVRDGLITSTTAPAQDESGTYIIENEEQLGAFAAIVNSGNAAANGRMNADVELTGTLYGGSADEPIVWKPIGTAGAGGYKGTFDGDGHTIKTIYMTGSERQGLFGTLGDRASISNVISEANSINPQESADAIRYLGGIAGLIEGSNVTVTECKINGLSFVTDPGSVTYVGGVAGYISGTNHAVTKCQNLSEIVANAAYVGGIAGGIENGTGIVIDGCANTETAVITGKTDTGGILGGGVSGNAIVRNCFNQGRVNGTGSYFGGIAGSLSPDIKVTGCYNAGLVTSSESGNAGTLGSIAGANTGTGNITSCFYLDTCIPDASAKPLTSAQFQTWKAACGLNGGRISQPTGISWTYVSGDPYPTYGTLTDVESWEIVGMLVDEGFLDEKPALSGNIYTINNAEQLAWFARQINTGAIAVTTGANLTANIDLAGSGYIGSGRLPWVPIGKTASLAFQGVFGGGHQKIYEIQNLYVNTENHAGLFGVVGGNGTIRHVGIVRCSVTVTDTAADETCYAGGIAGQVNGNAVVSRCYNRAGSVINASGKYAGSGGIAGRVDGKSVIEDCYHLDSVVTGTGTGSEGAYSGGIVGEIRLGTSGDERIRNCYNACGSSGSIISSTGNAGGIAGNSKSAFNTAVTRCYSEALLGTDAGNDVIQLGTTDEKRQSDVDSLNTLGGNERTGAGRVWYTSLKAEETRGLPTLKAPEMIAVEIAPAATDGGTTVSLGSGDAIPDTFLRSLRLDVENGSTDTFSLTDAGSMAGSFHHYGTTNANARFGLKAGTTDLSSLAQSLTEPADPVGAFSQLTLYTAAAYTHAAERKLFLETASDTARYEITITIPGVTSKPLVIRLPVTAYIELDPNTGTAPVSYSADLELENRNDYPVKAAISSVEQLSGKDVTLTPIARTSSIDPFQPVTTAGIRLGITAPEAGTDTGNIAGQPDGKIYYTPAVSGNAEKWMTGELGYGKTLGYRYFIEHSRVHGGADQSFGFKIVYRFEIQEGDNTGTVTVAPAS